MSRVRSSVKAALARLTPDRPARGATVLIYHRVGGGSSDERDVTTTAFARHLDILQDRDVVSLDTALHRMDGGDDSPGVVLTFDDGFADVYENAWPLLREREVPFTLYLATAYVGATMHWEGSTATKYGPALCWSQVEEMVSSGLCTVGNHTHRHVSPDRFDAGELDECSDAIERCLGVRPRHFAFPWGVPVDGAEEMLQTRFRSAATAQVGRNLPGQDSLRLRRIPVRRTDPPAFFRAKVAGGLLPERAYAYMTSVAKKAGIRG